MSITGRVVLAVTFQKVHHAPDTEARAQGDHKGLCTYGVSVEQQKRDTIDENGIPAL